MRCPPDFGTVTVCEINTNLITADVLSDDRAKEAYGKGMVFRVVPFQPDGAVRSMSEDYRVVRQEVEDGGGDGVGAATQKNDLIDEVQGIVGGVVKRFFRTSDVKLVSHWRQICQ